MDKYDDNGLTLQLCSLESWKGQNVNLQDYKTILLTVKMAHNWSSFALGRLGMNIP